MKKTSKETTTKSVGRAKAQKTPVSGWVKRAYNMLDYYDHKVFRAFLFVFIRTAILSLITFKIFESINRSNEFFAIFVPALLFFISSVHRYCYIPAMESPFIYNMAFFYSGVTMVTFNVFTRNAGIGMLSTPSIPGSVIVIVPCIFIFLLIYLFGMKLDIIAMKKIRSFFGGLFGGKSDKAADKAGRNSAKNKKKTKEDKKNSKNNKNSKDDKKSKDNKKTKPDKNV